MICPYATLDWTLWRRPRQQRNDAFHPPWPGVISDKISPYSIGSIIAAIAAIAVSILTKLVSIVSISAILVSKLIRFVWLWQKRKRLGLSDSFGLRLVCAVYRCACLLLGPNVHKTAQTEDVKVSETLQIIPWRDLKDEERWRNVKKATKSDQRVNKECSEMVWKPLCPVGRLECHGPPGRQPESTQRSHRPIRFAAPFWPSSSFPHRFLNVSGCQAICITLLWLSLPWESSTGRKQAVPCQGAQPCRVAAKGS